MSKNWVSRKKSSSKCLAQWMKNIQTKMIVMTEKANKDPKSIRGNENGSQRISNQNNMKLYSSNTENQKTMKEWFQHFNLREHNFQHRILHIPNQILYKTFFVLSHFPPILLALSTHVMSKVQHTVFDHQKASPAQPWCHREKEPQSLRTSVATKLHRTSFPLLVYPQNVNWLLV